ncbi:MAG: hypothetical protein PHV18_05735 [Lachnospiraceae bacterium]|nr:hypothetical protein [Lachnospiraceae bacterium]
MEETLEKLFHVEISENENYNLPKMPLFLQNGYDIRVFSIQGENILFMKPKEMIAFSTLKKHWKRMSEIVDMECVICGDKYSRYGMQHMIELGIPFMFGEDHVYLPNLGIILRNKRQAQLPEIEKFSTFTQKMILQAIYGGWSEKSTKEISEAMGVSRITVNRALVEFQALHIPITVLEGKTRYLRMNHPIKSIYEMCEPFFFNPVIKEYHLADVPKNVSCLGGISALANYTMLGDNSYRTYVCGKEEAKKYGLDSCLKIPKYEVPACNVQVLKYVIEWNGCIDPISAVLSISEKDRRDPRVEGAIEEVLEEVFDGRWNREI